MENTLPVYNIVIGDGGLEFVSIVAEPAIMELGLAFSKQEMYKFNKDKQVIVGPAMIPDLPLYRNMDGHQFYVVFTKEVIEKLAEQFNRSSKEYKINLEHDSVIESAFIKSNWIIEDKENDKSNMYGFSLPEGTWMVEAKVSDPEFWNKEIKEAGRFGFSVEGLFDLELQKFTNKTIEMENEKVGALSASEIEMILKARAFKEEVKVEEEVKEEVKEEVAKGTESVKAAEEVIDEVPVVEEEEVSEPMDEAGVLAIVQPKLDEIVTMIAELKTLFESKGEVKEEEKVVSEQVFSKVASLDFIKSYREKYND